MTDITMGKRKTQSDLPPDPNAAITAAIVANDPRALALALVDRVSGIVGNHQVRVEEGQDAVHKAVQDMRYQQAESNRLTMESNDARAKNQAQIALFLESQGRQLGAVSVGLADLADEFRRGMAAIGERVTSIEADVGDLKQVQRTINARLSAAERIIDERPAQRAEEQRVLKEAIDGVSARLDQFLQGLIAQTPEAAQQYRNLLDQLLQGLIAQTPDDAQQYRELLDQLRRERGGG